MSELRAEGLTKRYRARQVVNNVSLHLSGGEVVGLLGPNGAGKTTCFYMIVGLIRSDAGTIRLDERDITASPMHVRARLGLGYLPQEASVFRKLTVAQNILAILETLPNLDRAQRVERCDVLLGEPFAGGDPISVMDLEASIKQLTEKGIGVLITDHIVRETLGICGRAYIMSEGQVIAEGAPDLILQNARVRQVYHGEHFTL